MLGNQHVPFMFSEDYLMKIGAEIINLSKFLMILLSINSLT